MAGIVPTAAVAEADVEHPVAGAERQVAAVVVVERMTDAEDLVGRGSERHAAVQALPARDDLCPLRGAAQVACVGRRRIACDRIARVREVHLVVLLPVGMERHTEEARLSAERDGRVHEGSDVRVARRGPRERDDLAVDVHEVEAIVVARSLHQGQRSDHRDARPHALQRETRVDHGSLRCEAGLVGGACVEPVRRGNGTCVTARVVRTTTIGCDRAGVVKRERCIRAASIRRGAARGGAVRAARVERREHDGSRYPEPPPHGLRVARLPQISPARSRTTPS